AASLWRKGRLASRPARRRRPAQGAQARDQRAGLRQSLPLDVANRRLALSRSELQVPATGRPRRALRDEPEVVGLAGFEALELGDDAPPVRPCACAADAGPMAVPLRP